MSETEYKVCTKCGEEKPIYEFGADKRARDGKRSSCKKCACDWWREYRKNNLDKARRSSRESNLKWRSREENRRKKRLYDYEYRRRYSERIINGQKLWRENNADKKRRMSRDWNRRNKKRVQMAKLRYKARQKQLENNFSLDDYVFSLEYWHNCCAVCGRQLNSLFGEHTAAMDHWIPLSYEGDDNPGTVPHNILPLCHGIDGCNNSKGAKDPVEWLIEKLGKRKAKKKLKEIEEYFDIVFREQNDYNE